MAPEVLSGDHEPDGRVDIYALGCVAYWLVTGHLVFDAPSGMKMLLRHASEEPVPPSQRSELEIPSSLEEIILACLAKDPDDRPSSVTEVEALLAATRLDRHWTVEQRGRWWESHRPRASAAPPG
jgi:serine/threonine-protein kinase